MTNAQAALIAAATWYGGADVPQETVLLVASEFKNALDLQDEVDKSAKTRRSAQLRSESRQADFEL